GLDAAIRAFDDASVVEHNFHRPVAGDVDHAPASGALRRRTDDAARAVPQRHRDVLILGIDVDRLAVLGPFDAAEIVERLDRFGIANLKVTLKNATWLDAQALAIIQHDGIDIGLSGRNGLRWHFSVLQLEEENGARATPLDQDGDERLTDC